MAFREVLVTEVVEVLRAWLSGQGKRPAAARAGVDVKTAARYIAAGQQAGLSREGGAEQLTDELLGAVIAAVRPARPAGRGPTWQLLEERKEEITGWVEDKVPVVKIGELLERSGTVVPYRTLARFAVEECGYRRGGRKKVTVPVDDPEPGRELQVDFGYLGLIGDEETGRRRRLYALVFTAVCSRYCYVHLTFRQTTEAVIAGCEAAWAFYGGIFPVLIPDNLKPVVDKAHRAEPRWNRDWLEYSQARGFTADPARVRSPQDKGRVENGVKFVQGSFFAGENFTSLAQAQARALEWCRGRSGLRVHGRTRQKPAEVFAAREAPLLAPPPQEPYQIPWWGEVSVQRDFHVRACNAFYSAPYVLVGQRVTVRADASIVKIYHRGQVVRTHPRQPPGGRKTLNADFPPGTDVYARRDVDKLARMAARHGESIGIYADRLLAGDMPWSKMRAVYMLIGLARKYGDGPVNQACAAALEVDVISVGKIGSIVEKAAEKHARQVAREHTAAAAAPAAPPRPARFARDPSEFAGPARGRQQMLPGMDDDAG